MLRILALTLLLAFPATATEVDVELVLLADTTGSIDEAEALFQRQGYAEAITDPRVLNAIASTLTGRIAVTYVEWAGPQDQVPVVGWTIIDGPKAAESFAASLMIPPRLAYGSNAIGAALLAGKEMIETNDITGLRRVIDFSGDSANNRAGPAVAPARAEVLAAGITINALALYCRGCSGPAGSGDVAQRYRDEIIGGPGAFVVAVETPDQFVETVVRKLILEIAALDPVLPDRPYRMSPIGSERLASGDFRPQEVERAVGTRDIPKE
jgi:hypothetical protein